MTDPGATAGGVLFVLSVIFIAVQELAADRRLPFRIRQLVANPGELRQFGSLVATNVPPERALMVAKSAVERLSERQARTYEGRLVMAWKGRVLTNIPRWAPYQVVAAIHPNATGGFDLLCGVRPRYRTQFLSFSYANRLSNQLAKDIAVALSDSR